MNTTLIEYKKLLNDKVITIDEFCSKCEEFIKNQPPFITTSTILDIDNKDIKNKLIIYKSKSRKEVMELIKKDIDYYMIAQALDIKDEEAFINQCYCNYNILIIKKHIFAYKKRNGIDNADTTDYSEIDLQDMKDTFISLAKDFKLKLMGYERIDVLYRNGSLSSMVNEYLFKQQ